MKLSCVFYLRATPCSSFTLGNLSGHPLPAAISEELLTATHNVFVFSDGCKFLNQFVYRDKLDCLVYNALIVSLGARAGQ